MRRTQQIIPELLILRFDLQMKMEAVPVRMNFFRIITAHRPAIYERDEFCSIVGRGPLGKMFHFNTDYRIQFQVSIDRYDFGRRRRQWSWTGDLSDLRRRTRRRSWRCGLRVGSARARG